MTEGLLMMKERGDANGRLVKQNEKFLPSWYDVLENSHDMAL
jgi:hypothetical protein